MLLLWTTLFLPIAFCNDVHVQWSDNGDLTNEWLAGKLRIDYSNTKSMFNRYPWPSNRLHLSHGILQVGPCEIRAYPYYNTNRYSLYRDKRFDNILLSTVQLSTYLEIYVDNFKQCVQACLSVSGCRAVDIKEKSSYPNKHLCHLRSYGIEQGGILREKRNDYEVSERSMHVAIEKCEYRQSAPNGPGIQARWYQSKKTEPLRMENGQATTAHSWPWIVDVAIFVDEGQPLRFCTGILIHSKYSSSNTDRVLVPASCLMNGRKRTVETQSGRQTLDITPGELQLDSSILVIAGKEHGSEFEDNQQLRKTEKIRIHRDFDTSSQSVIPENDMALIKVSPPFEYSETVRSIRVSGKKKGFFTLKGFKGSNKKQCASVGWCHEHASTAGMSRKFVQHVEYLMDQKECEKMWAQASGKRVHSDQQKAAIICSKLEQQKEPGCIGDEKSMLICRNKDEEEWMLEGLSTFLWKEGTQFFMSFIAESEWITEANVH